MHLYLGLIAVRNVLLLLLKYLIGNGLALSEKEITLIRLIYFIFYVLTLREKNEQILVWLLRITICRYLRCWSEVQVQGSC